MLNHNLGRKPLLSLAKKVFTRGQYEFNTLQEVAEKDPEYLLFLVTQSYTDEGTRGAVNDFINTHPDYFAEVEL